MTLTAKRIEKRQLRRGIGLETIVDIAAIAIVILGFLVTLILLVTGPVASGCTLIGTFFNWLLLRCLAEHLRLQKKIAGCEFQGKISGPSEEVISTCSYCGQMLHSNSRCDACGAQIVPEDG